jgi:hypothetical protein
VVKAATPHGYPRVVAATMAGQIPPVCTQASSAGCILGVNPAGQPRDLP